MQKRRATEEAEVQFILWLFDMNRISSLSAKMGRALRETIHLFDRQHWQDKPSSPFSLEPVREDEDERSKSFEGQKSDQPCITDPLVQPRVARSWPITLLILFGVLLIGLTISSTAILVSNFRARALADNERELKNITLILAEQIDRAFHSVELIQISVIERIQAQGIISSSDYEQKMSSHDTHLMLRDKISGAPHVDAVTMISAEGKLINFSRYWPIPDVNVSDRDYFKALKSDPNLFSFISEPVRNRGTGTWTIYIARKVIGSNGDFVGLVLVAMELHYFEKLFGTIALNPSGSISLFRRDGVLLARHPRVDVVARSYGTSAIFVKLLADSDRGVGRQVSVIDGKDRLIAAHAVPHYPVVVAATTTIAAALAGWQTEAKILIGSGALVAILISVVILLITRPLLRGHKRSHEDIHRQKIQLDTALNNMHQGLLMFDSRGELVLHNQRFLKMYGLSSEAIKPGDSLLDVLRLRKIVENCPGDADQCADGLLNEIELGGNPQAIDDANERNAQTREVELPDGRIISITNQVMPGIGWVSTHDDVTQWRLAERERDRNQAFLDLVIENVPAVIVVKDPEDFRYILINRAGEEYYGVSRERMIGKTAHDVFPKEVADYIIGLDEKLLQSGHKVITNEHTLETPGHGTRTAISTKLSVFGGQGKPQYLLSVIEDMTEQRAIEHQLQQAQKMEAIGNLTGGLAHDFNNLLTVIIGNLDLLQDDISNNAPAQQKVDLILEASSHGADLTRQMLAFSRRQPLRPRHIDLNELVNKTSRLLMRTIGENIAVDLRMGVDLWPVLVDESQLEAALLNIAINARDAMPDGGTLIIETRKTHFDEGYAVLHPEVTPGDHVLIEISDTGTGMSSEVLARIFEPFFTTKTPDKGSGLGLSMAYGFIKQSRGHISVCSELGKGTTFRLYLPSAEKIDTELKAASVTEVTLGRASGEVILAVDDNSAVRTTTAKQLRDLGYQVLEAENAQSALDTLDAVPRIDLLFTDVVMPGGVDGKELAKRARKKRPNLKVLFTSGFPGAALANCAEINLDAPLLSKPYRKHDLARAVSDILDRP
jgi:PAS domain S-box-containing protein